MPKKRNPIDLGFLKSDTASTNLSGMFAASIASADAFAQGEGEMQQAVMVRIDRLLDNPYQPRAETQGTAVDELAQVIKSQGFQGVLVARPHPSKKGYYQLTAGHRRREAARRADLSTLPIVVRDLADEEMATLAITENIQREDLSALEEGKIYLLMINEMGFTHEQVAKEVGKKRGYVENRIRVAKAPHDVQALVQARPDTLRAVSYLVQVKDDKERREIIEQILRSTLTADDVPGFILAQAKSKVQSPKSQVQDDKVHAIVESRTLELGPGTLDFGPKSSSERDASRVGNARLQTVLRYLKSYKTASANREGISAQEQAALAKIKSLAEELYRAHCDQT